MPRGRPRNTFLSDPDRYVLAAAHMFREMGASRRGAIEIAVACIEGVVVGPNTKLGWGRGIKMLDASYELRQRGDSYDIADRARWLRRKMKEAAKDEAAVRWLAAMSGAWHIALNHGSEKIILDLAGLANEVEYARRVLVPFSRRRYPGLKKLQGPNFRPQTLPS